MNVEHEITLLTEQIRRLGDKSKYETIDFKLTLSNNWSLVLSNSEVYAVTDLRCVLTCHIQIYRGLEHVGPNEALKTVISTSY